MPFRDVQKHETSAKPVTRSDKSQGVSHHADSMAYNLAHAAVHTKEAQREANKLKKALARVPAVKKHTDALLRAKGGK